MGYPTPAGPGRTSYGRSAPSTLSPTRRTRHEDVAVLDEIAPRQPQLRIRLRPRKRAVRGTRRTVRVPLTPPARQLVEHPLLPATRGLEELPAGTADLNDASPTIRARTAALGKACRLDSSDHPAGPGVIQTELSSHLPHRRPVLTRAGVDRLQRHHVLRQRGFLADTDRDTACPAPRPEPHQPEQRWPTLPRSHGQHPSDPCASHLKSVRIARIQRHPPRRYR